MEKVKAEVVTHYRSALIEHIRANNCTFAHGSTGIRLAKEFGFCYGVERAIDLAYAARRHFPLEQPVYILGEIIHNPHVNEQIRDMGVTFLSGTYKAANLNDLGEGDPVVIPAFGTEVGITDKLNERGCTIIDATCGDVMSVWKRVRRPRRSGAATISSCLTSMRQTKFADTSPKAATARSSFKSSRMPYRMDSTRTSTSSPSVWRTRPQCCAAKPRKCSGACGRQ